jgi:hypothetical protein
MLSNHLDFFDWPLQQIIEQGKRTYTSTALGAFGECESAWEVVFTPYFSGTLASSKGLVQGHWYYQLTITLDFSFGYALGTESRYEVLSPLTEVNSAGMTLQLCRVDLRTSEIHRGTCYKWECWLKETKPKPVCKLLKKGLKSYKTSRHSIPLTKQEEKALKTWFKFLRKNYHSFEKFQLQKGEELLWG